MLALTAVLSAQSQSPSRTPANPNQIVTFHIFLPLTNTDQLDGLLADLHNSASRNYRKWITAQNFKTRFGPRESDVAAITAELAPRGLRVVNTHSHGLRVQGSIAAIESALGVTLWNSRTPSGATVITASRPLKLPASMTQAGAHVLAFSTAPVQTYSIKVGPTPDNIYSTAGPYWFDDMKQAYDFPSYRKLTGAGRKIGIVMAGDFLDSDMDLYFGHELLPRPKIVRVPIDGGAGIVNESFETTLDIQQAGGMAPGAAIYDFITPDLALEHTMEAYLEIVETNAVDIVNSSWGTMEPYYTSSYGDSTDGTWMLRAFDEVFKQGNAEGITFVASSGDNGALGVVPPDYFTAPPQDPPAVIGTWQPGISFPASSPHVTAVGGTNLITASNPPSRDSRYVSENAFADPVPPYDPYGFGNLVAGGYIGSGGGLSVVFPKPPYQYLVNTGAAERSIPDIAMHMGGSFPNPGRSADLEVFGGNYYVVIGTSASSPDFAGVLALAEQNLGIRLGNVNYLIYGLAAAQQVGLSLYRSFHQGIPGDDGLYSSQQGTSGYNFLLGNGTPLVKNLILAPLTPPAGIPQTPTNP
jgi:subtilase family serine protease